MSSMPAVPGAIRPQKYSKPAIRLWAIADLCDTVFKQMSDHLTTRAYHS